MDSNLFEDRSYLDWSEDDVAQYILKHCPKQSDEVNDRIHSLFADKQINGRKIEEIAKDDQLLKTLWTPLVTNLPLDLPVPELKRGLHPTLAALVDIPKKLLDSGSGIWSTLHKFYKRMEKFDAVYQEEEGYWCHDRNGRPYFNPGSWRRYGFFPEVQGEGEDQVEEIMKNWHVAYHGTKLINVNSIVEFGLVPPGTMVGGSAIKNERGKAGVLAGDKIPIYVTPSIAYAAHWLYTSPAKDGDEYVYCVFQVRIRPGSFKIQGNTLWAGGWGDKSIIFDERFGPDELEWLVADSNDVRVTGLMVHRDKEDPKEKIKNLFEKHKQMTSVSRVTSRGRWYWNSAPANGKTLDKNGPFTPYDDVANTKIEKAFLNWQSVCFLGYVDTKDGIKAYFVDFKKMEQINCKDNKLRRAIKRE